MSLTVQLQLLVRLILFGFYIGVTYDVFSTIILRKTVFSIVKLLLSVCYWTYSAFTFYNYIYPINYYVLPIYSVPLMFISFLLYLMFFREKTLDSLDILDKLLKIISKHFLILLKFSIISPIINIINLFKKFLTLILFIIKKYFKKPRLFKIFRFSKGVSQNE